MELVVQRTGAPAARVEAVLRRQVASTLRAVKARVAYDVTFEATLSTLTDEEQASARDDEAEIQARLAAMGKCPAGFLWHREGDGWRCGGGTHFVHNDDPLLRG